jgi:NADH dehydrogenase [ubiquinone] 1 alpha subcomplex assembly factor 7
LGKPEEAALACERMNALGARIAGLIAAQGPLTVAQYMTIAMHDRDYGYYATRDPLGAEGDFVTAPEVSQMFGELVGLWCAQTWHDQGKPKSARLIELGPGRGTLMSDALRAARLMPEFLAAIDIVFVESNPALRTAQETALKDANAKIAWANDCDSRLFDRPVFLIANEFFDALPIRQLVRTDKGWSERMVTADASGALGFALSPVPADVAVPTDRAGAPTGAVYEFSDAATALAQEIAHGIARFGGAALAIDYGYGAPDFGETLQAVAAHGPAKLLEAPGEADISAGVDFAALARAAQSQAAVTYGPLTQSDFLTGLGINERADALKRAARGSPNSIDLDLNRLIEADEMGELFKALAILPAGASKPPGF